MRDKQKDRLSNKQGQKEGLACQLEADRKATELKDVFALMVGCKEYKQGYAFQFPGDEAILDKLVRVIKLERKCCPFLTFELKVENDDRPIWLHISGPEGTAAFLQSELNLVS